MENNKKYCPILWQLVLGKKSYSLKQIKKQKFKQLQISAKQLILLFKHQPREYLQDVVLLSAWENLYISAVFFCYVVLFCLPPVLPIYDSELIPLTFPSWSVLCTFFASK